MSDVKLKRKPQGILCDISGVLKNSVDGSDVAIDGSIDAFRRLKDSGLPFVLCSNESCYSTRELADKLERIGFSVTPDQIINPISAIQQIIRSGGHRPYVLVNERVTKEFESFDQTEPDVVVVGDAEDGFTYEAMNRTFQLLINGNRKFYSLGKSKFYKDSGQLKLDVGCWVAGLEYSSQRKAEVVGKPSKMFFLEAAKMIGVPPSEVLMIGDDVESDIGGALNAGLQGVLVRTGKFRPQDENHASVKPTFVADNLKHAVDVILSS